METGIEPRPHGVEAQSLKHWATRKIPDSPFSRAHRKNPKLRLLGQVQNYACFKGLDITNVWNGYLWED